MSKSILTPNEIADEAFTKIAKKHGVERHDEDESWETALYWKLGLNVDYSAIREVVLEAISAVASQGRQPLASSADMTIDLDTGTVLDTNLVAVPAPEDEVLAEDITTSDSTAIAYGTERGMPLFI